MTIYHFNENGAVMDKKEAHFPMIPNYIGALKLIASLYEKGMLNDATYRKILDKYGKAAAQ